MMQELEIKNVDCHATLAMIEKRWGFPRRTLRALLGMTKSGQSGRSMIEMLGVLAIIGVLSVGGIAGYSKAMHRYRINKSIEQITLIAGNVRSFFGPQKSYEGLDDRKVIKKAKLVPDEMWDGSSLNHVFDDTINIRSTYKIWNTDCISNPICSKQAFSMQLYNIPEPVCIDLITQDWSKADVSFIRVYNIESPYGLIDAYITLPVSIEHAIKLCQRTTNDVNIEEFFLYFDVDITQGDLPIVFDLALKKLNK